MSSPKEIPPQKFGTAAEQFREIQTRKRQVPFHNNSEDCQTKSKKQMPTPQPNVMEKTMILFSKKTDPQIQGMLIRAKVILSFTPLSATVVLGELYVPLNFENDRVLDNSSEYY